MEMERYKQPVDEQALLVLVTDLEDEIERLEAAKVRLFRAGRSDAHLAPKLRRLRRERASCLSVLIS